MCKELKLIIEVDGITHQYEETIKQDKKRQKKLEIEGFTVLRFEDSDVLNDINNVYHKIEATIDKLENQNDIPPPTPPPEADKAASGGQAGQEERSTLIYVLHPPATIDKLESLK